MTLKLTDIKPKRQKPWQRSKADTVQVDGKRRLKFSAKELARLVAKRNGE